MQLQSSVGRNCLCHCECADGADLRFVDIFFSIEPSGKDRFQEQELDAYPIESEPDAAAAVFARGKPEYVAKLRKSKKSKPNTAPLTTHSQHD